MKRIYILYGPSGAGKTTLGDYLKELGIPELVSVTTREKRNGEIEGINYNFVSIEEFNQLDKIEFNEYPKDSGKFYSLTKDELERKLAQNDKVFAVAELEGIKQVKAQYPGETKTIYISIPGGFMTDRMKNRGDSDVSIQMRLAQAERTNELSHYIWADYVVENKDLSLAKQRLKEIVTRDNDDCGITRRFLIERLPSLQEIPKREILDFSSLPNSQYYILMGNNIITLCVYQGNANKLDTAEVEFLSKKESLSFVPPTWFGEEIIDDKHL